MKAYETVKIEVLELKEDIVRTSGGSIGGVNNPEDLNQYDDVFQFGV